MDFLEVYLLMRTRTSEKEINITLSINIPLIYKISLKVLLLSFKRFKNVSSVHL